MPNFSLSFHILMLIYFEGTEPNDQFEIDSITLNLPKVLNLSEVLNFSIVFNFSIVLNFLMSTYSYIRSGHVLI